MKAKTYDVVTNGIEFRLIDGDGNFYTEEKKTPWGMSESVAKFKTKEEAEQKAKELSWVFC